MIRYTRGIERGYERSLESYLREIGRYSLLTRQQEVELARSIRQGDEGALNSLVRANLRFVVTVAKQYVGQGLTLQDLINEGNIGLIKAARRFDEERGFKFISYAVWWIRQAILHAISEQSRIVRLPQNRTVVLHRIARVRGRLQQRLGRSPRADEIAEETGLSLNDVRTALKCDRPEVHLEDQVAGEDGRSVADTLEDDPERGTEVAVLERTRREDINGMLGSLPEREARILRLYYGMGEQKPLTLEEIGNQMGLTRERIRQLKERALGRLRHHDQVEVLRVHYEEA